VHKASHHVPVDALMIVTAAIGYVIQKMLNKYGESSKNFTLATRPIVHGELGCPSPFRPCWVGIDFPVDDHLLQG